MDDLTKTAFRRRPDLHVETSGEFAGWRTWSRDKFETHNGPFYQCMEEDAQIRCAFRVEKKHLPGMLKSAERPLFTFSGTIKRVKRRSLPVPSNDAR